MITTLHQSTNILTATLTDDAGDPVTGATVTVTILGTAIEDASMDAGAVDGDYEYTIAWDLLTGTGDGYAAVVKAVKSGNTRSAKIAINNEWDTD